MGNEAGKSVEGPGVCELLEKGARPTEGTQAEVRYSGLGN